MTVSLAGLERNAVVAASAGTGKTHLITNIFIAHVLGLRSDGDVVAAERIVATTFSRAAAREIRERLELRLALLCGEAHAETGIGLDADLSALVSERGLSSQTLTERAATALEALPRCLIDTLHGLAIRLLQKHAVELGIPPGFGVLDEQEALEEARGTIEDVLAEALSRGPEASSHVRALVELCQGLENTSVAVAQLLSLLDEEGLEAEELVLPEHGTDAAQLERALADALRGLLACAPDHPLRGAAATAQRALSDLPAAAAELHEALVSVTKPNRRQLEKIENGRYVLELMDALVSPRKNSSREDRIRASVEFLGQARLLDREGQGLRALLGEVQRQLIAKRRTRGSFAFGDLLRLARDSLRDHPELAARSAAEIELLLVDEFQDTSRVQRDLVFLLREAASSARARRAGALPPASALSPRGLVVVGDRKQSIYAFRGADVSVFARLAAELAGAPAIEQLELRGVPAPSTPVADLHPLVRNYRSQPRILEFVNRVASADFTQQPQKAYEIRFMPSEALAAPAGRDPDSGQVTLLFDDGKLPEGADVMVSTANPALRQALLAAAFCAREKRRGAAFRDIALLARRRATLPLLELALDRLAVPFVVSGRALYATPEVRDLAALLRLALEPFDRFSLAVVARSPLGGVSDQALALLSDPERGILPFNRWAERELSDPSQATLIAELAARLTEVCQIGPRLSPRDFLAFAYERFELERVLGSLPRGALRVGNVGRLLEIAARHGGSLPQFVRWLDRQIALDVDEHEAATFSEDDDAVRLLTIHASKGLSFPITVLLDLGVAEQPRPAALGLMRRDDGRAEFSLRHRNEHGAVFTPALVRAGAEASARSHAERQRLSYVALTRAERELVLVMPDSSKAARENTLARTLQLQLDQGLADSAAVRSLPALELLAEAPFEPAATQAAFVGVERPAQASWHSATVGVTALADFSVCPRRFQLLHVLGLAEPNLARMQAPHRAEAEATDSARALGSAAHRVLERLPFERWGDAWTQDELLQWLAREGLDPVAESTQATAAGITAFVSGSYAREVRTRAVRVHRELELTLVMLRGRAEVTQKRQLELFAPAPNERRGVLRATLDLVIERSDGLIDIIDYKRSRGGGARRYALQLAAYRAAVAQNLPLGTIRTGLVNLLGDAAEPEWVEEGRFDLYAAIERLAEARYRHDFPAVPKRRCQEAHCGFVAACYPSERKNADERGA